ncbi:MAG: serine/threonine-protein phosphatase [Myxococcales bacterium]|nr:serine/threonine-protein phosphatase [Myxococcales bacterium]
MFERACPPGASGFSSRHAVAGVTVRFAGKTDIGRHRDLNEDAFLVLPDYRFMVVADGLGGHRSGQVASQLAVSTLHDFFVVTVRPDATWPFPYDEKRSDEENYLATGIRLANRRIFDRSLKTLADFGMGTTCVAAMFAPEADEVAIANVGDSRSYRIRNHTLEQLTRDHSLVSDAIHVAPWMTPDEIAQLPPNVITRALGIREDVLIDVARHKVVKGDALLLCSDGLTGQLSDAEILEIIDAPSTRAPGGLEKAVEQLVDRTNELGGADNVTVVLALVD